VGLHTRVIRALLVSRRVLLWRRVEVKLTSLVGKGRKVKETSKRICSVVRVDRKHNLFVKTQGKMRKSDLNSQLRTKASTPALT